MAEMNGVPGWAAVADGAPLFTREHRANNGWSMRTTAVVLKDGSLALVTPTRGMGDEAHAALATLGAPAVLLAPNHFHHLGLSEHLRRYPDATVVASKRAAPRLGRKTGLEIAPLSALEQRLPAGVTLLEPPALRTGEVWLRAETPRGIAWMVTDGFFHCPDTPSGMFGVGCMLTGTTPGLRLGRTFTLLAVENPRPYRDWLLSQLDRDRPRILIPAHGDILEADDVWERLRRLATARLRGGKRVRAAAAAAG